MPGGPVMKKEIRPLNVRENKNTVREEHFEIKGVILERVEFL